MLALNKGQDFYQAEVELIQALTLCLKPEELGIELVPPDIVQNCLDNLPKISKAFASRRLAVLQNEKSKQEKSVILLQEHLRQHTQSVRNWGYVDTVIQILSNLFAYFDQEFINQIEISATQILCIFKYIIDRSKSDLKNRHQKLKHVFEQKTVQQIVMTYDELFECDDCGADEFVKDLEQHNVTIEQIKLMLLAHSDLHLQEVYTFTSVEIANALHIPMKPVKWILDQISIPFGGLADKQPEHIFLDNPIWTKPMVRLDGGCYFCALPMLLFGFAFHILNDISAKNQNTKRSYHNGKAKFLENEIARLFENAFSGCEIKSSYEWVDGDRTYENDLLVRIDSHLFIVEAKSHSVSWPALRGAPDRTKRHIRDTILEPSIQSWRLAKRIRKTLEKPKLQEKILPQFPISLDGVHTVLRLSVTLEDFAVIQTNQHLFKDIGWIPENHRLAPCILLADLKNVFELLDSMPQRIHYLRRRSELNENIAIFGDETDFIGFYLTTGFNIGTTEFSNKHLIITGMSKAVDEYCMARAEGIERIKPQLSLTSRWENILQAIENRRSNGWTDMACILLNCSYEDQQNSDKMFTEISRDIHRTHTAPKHLSSVILIPHEHRTDALVFYGFKEVEKEGRYDIMHDLASQTFEQKHIQKCLVIGINIANSKQPYSTLICFFKDARSCRTDFDVR
ncbi:MAG: NERD domain-containing protein [Candidatus Electrothrix sp. GM3_4]|nr:NERD domain-containing protein [Candidatus Electrothrix sp. GM3_4]